MFIDIILLLKIMFCLLFTLLVERWPLTTQRDVNGLLVSVSLLPLSLSRATWEAAMGPHPWP